MIKRTFLKGLAALALTAWVMPSFAADASDPAEGYVAINYFRADGDYGGWGLHVWSRIPGGSDSPLDGVSWLAPLKPAGKTEDGAVFWHVKLEDFGKSGKVWYIIHKRDTKEQGGKDQSFDGKTIKQIWVNQNDIVTYTSKEEAIKARKQ
jgi:hypothetical protein